MYGVVNKAIQGLVTENFGQEKWEQVRLHSGVNVDTFISNDQYDDSITFKLAMAASAVLKMSLKEVLHAFGKYWVLKTGKQHYGSLMDAGGSNLREFLVNLPNFHSRIMLLYPNIKPPEFKTVVISETEIHLHYFSTRTGLTDFAEGLVMGLADAFHEQVTVRVIQQKGEKNTHDVFQICW
jgi:hypothetical protein